MIKNIKIDRSIKVYKDKLSIKYKYKEWLDIESLLSPQQLIPTKKKHYAGVVAVLVVDI